MSEPFPEAGAPHTVLFAKVRQLLARAPFEPFRIVTTSGQAYDVPTADHAGTVPISRIVEIAADDSSLTMIHALQIAAIEPLRRKRRRTAA